MTKAERFLTETAARMTALGHTPRPWSKGRWGFCMNCTTCGAVVRVCVSDQRVREFPDDTCAERLQRVGEA